MKPIVDAPVTFKLQAGYPKSVEVQDQASADRGRTGPYPSHVGGGAPAAGSMGYSHRATTGTGTKLFGKVESTLGSMVGSHDLKARGLEKQRDVKLADAERLESQRKWFSSRGLGFIVIER